MKGALALVAVVVLAMVGLYATAKPYQKERILITLKQGFHSTER